MFDFFKKKKLSPEPPKQFPPVPKWRPSIQQPLERIADRLRYYTDNSRDFAVFRNGTCVLLDEGLTDEEAEVFAKDVLQRIFNAHPDMNPLDMDDGNVLVRYNHPAVNIVLEDVAQANWSVIENFHQDALATHEVLITPLGTNVFDAFGKKALFGRCYMFMDAQDPHVAYIGRNAG